MAMARQQLDKAVESTGGHERVLRQTVMAFAKGSEQSEHEANGEAAIAVPR
ncbi:hypothetical protein ACWEN6_27005 [Sphaerisporangium sp. NPDC004334]